MDPLFPALPEDLHALSDEDLASLESEHVAALRMISEDDREFLGDLNAIQVVEQGKAGKAQLDAIRAHKAELAAAVENYQAEIASFTADLDPVEEEAEAVEEAEVELSAEVEEAEVVEEEAQLVASSVALRRPPAPSKERVAPPVEQETGAILTASASIEGTRAGDPLDPSGLAMMMKNYARRLGKPSKSQGGTEERYLLASANYRFPPERTLTSDIESNAQKIRSLVNTEGRSLLASGGLCAPLTPLYTIPQFATNARPVRDALVSFNADRGGVNVPVPTTLAAAEDAITIITEANDALGGTFATKACLDQDCLSFVETAVTIISHCREYGNLNARAWPESITFENELTMAEHARVAEGYLLDRIKTQSINVTTATVYSTTYDLIYAAARAVAAIRYRLRTGPNFRFRALFPEWIREQVVVDIAANQFDRFVALNKFNEIMRNVGIEASFYLDTPTSGTSQGFSDEAAGALDDFPDEVQWALFPEGAFIHVDGGSLELGLVRDSTLNSTNDFQFFGETFENVALLAPAQAALWVTSTVCPSGEFPSLTTALSC